MVICAGPTGGGKTTTLYATLAEINASELNIMTVEDPVEYVFPSINQMQTKIRPASLRRRPQGDPASGPRRDPRRRDPRRETARIAIQSALTGHFVLSSLHATDAVAALHRFLDMGIEPFLVASSVVGVVGQRLVRRICRYCKVPYSRRPRSSSSTSCPAATPRAISTMARAATSASAPATGTGSASTSCCASRGDEAAPDAAGPTTTRSRRSRRRACARSATAASSWCKHDVTTIPEVVRNIYTI